MGIDDDHWQRVSPLLDCALELAAEERAEWLVGLRAKEPALAAEVEMLLEEARASANERFLERGPSDVPRHATLAGQVVGAYTLVSPLGRGGMGTVWLARRSDGRFEGTVAVKF